jgi:hypothetical protein
MFMFMVPSMLQAAVGGRMRFFISGGAPLPTYAGSFMATAMIVPVLQVRFDHSSHAACGCLRRLFLCKACPGIAASSLELTQFNDAAALSAQPQKLSVRKLLLLFGLRCVYDISSNAA